MSEPFCCYFGPADPAAAMYGDCTRTPVVEIRWGPTECDYTHACADHVADLCDVELGEGYTEVEITPLDTPEGQRVAEIVESFRATHQLDKAWVERILKVREGTPDG